MVRKHSCEWYIVSKQQCIIYDLFGSAPFVRTSELSKLDRAFDIFLLRIEFEG